MALKKIETYSEEETVQFASRFANELESGAVVLLSGDLGMGKSVFARSIIQTLCCDELMAVPSPTFTLVQQYEAQDFMISHFDLYRLSTPDEIYEIGWEEALYSGISLVEWPERLGTLKLSKFIDVRISSSHDHTDKRIIEIEYS